MKAIVYTQHNLPIDDPASLQEVDVSQPVPGDHDLLVRVQAVAVNPVDTKIRRGVAVTDPRILGWDAAGVVEAVGSKVTLFAPGDEVFYAGALNRPGSYAEYQLVDERIVGRKPATLDWANSAAIPLTAITAWELLFDRLAIAEGSGEGKTLLIVGAAGGVGSILTQLASKLTKLTVIGTASRRLTREWVQELGAHHVIDHSKNLKEELAHIGIDGVDFVAALTHTDKHFATLVEAMAPQSHIAVIDDPETLDVMPLKRKSIALHWELMFTRTLYETDDMVAQHHILDRVAKLIDEGVLRTTLGEHFGAITADNMRRAHALVESNQSMGKAVLEGFKD